MISFLIIIGIIIFVGVTVALYWPPETPRKKLIQCDLCPQLCEPDGLHLERVPEAIGDQKRHNVHMYRHHAKKVIVQGNWHTRQLLKQRMELERLTREINSVPIGEEFLRTLDKE